MAIGFTASTGNGFENHDLLNWPLTQPGDRRSRERATPI